MVKRKVRRATVKPKASEMVAVAVDRIERIYLPPPLPPRPASGHKGLFGRVLVVGGHPQMFGAATLAATAALRAGSGLVQLAVPESALGHALSITPELVGLALRERFKSEDRNVLETSAAAASAIVLGPGMGQSALSLKRVRLLFGFKKSFVIDADALNILAASKSKWWRWITAPSVLTPHPVEMMRLGAHLGLDDATVPDDDRGRLDRAVLAANTFGQVVLLKGHRTVVTDGRRAYVNRTGDSSLSKAGSGDVLAGMIGTFLGQGMTPFDAACAGAWLHGKAGEIAGAKLGVRSVLARDVIAAIGEAFAQYPVTA